MGNYDKKIIKPRYGINAGRAMAQVHERNNTIKCNEDTIIRTEIHGIIVSKIREGKTKEDIIKDLCKNDRYKKYNMYFENWITHKMDKNIRKESRQK